MEKKQTWLPPREAFFLGEMWELIRYLTKPNRVHLLQMRGGCALGSRPGKAHMEMMLQLKAEQERSLSADVSSVSIHIPAEEQREGRISVDPRWTPEESVPPALIGHHLVQFIRSKVIQI